ncbi:MAG: hypothetical protein ACI4P3_03380 [Candidatus Spyradosoma sp.]
MAFDSERFSRAARWIYVAALASCAAALLLCPPRVRTNLLGLLGTAGTQEETALVALSRANALRFQVLIEADDFATAKRGAEEFSRAVPERFFRTRGNALSSGELRGLLDYYASHGSGLLSEEDRAALLAERFSEVSERAAMHWLSPVAGGVPAKRDPFGLTTRFLAGLPFSRHGFAPEDGVLAARADGKVFVFLAPELEENLGQDALCAAADALTSVEIPGVRVHVSGVPLHTVSAARNSRAELNALAFVGAGALLALLLALFRSLRFLVPVSASVAAGVLGGGAATALVFPEPHVLTFVFGTTLVGLAADYSFHFYLRGNENVSRPMLMAFLTTAIGFSVLWFSSFPVLRQMALFSVVGLAFVLAFVLLFEEKLLASASFPPRVAAAEKFACRLAGFCRAALARGKFALAVFVAGGICLVSVKDDARALYRPNDELAERDRFFMRVAGVTGESAFCVVPGADAEDVARREERAGLTGTRISAFLPSAERQRENAALVRELFAREDLAGTLGLPGKFVFEETPPVSLESAPPALKRLAEALYFREPGGDFSVVPVSSDFKAPEGMFTLTPGAAVSSLLESYRGQTYRLLAAAFAALFLVLFAVYRRRAFRLLFAPAAAIATVVAVSGFCGVPLSFFHFLSFFLVVGFTLDYGVFRMAGGRGRELPVLLSCATSALSFGLLAFTSFALTRSMGVALGLGLAFAYFYSAVAGEPSAGRPRAGEWFEQKEQGAGRLRLAVLWAIYRFCPLFVFRISLAVVGFVIFLAARPAREASRAYRRVLNAARERRGLPPAKFSSLAHVMAFTFSLFDKIDAASLRKSGIAFRIEENEDFRALRDAANAGKGMFFLCSHVGNIEILQSLHRSRSDLAPRVMHAFQDVEQSGIFLEFYRRHCRAENVFIHPTRDVDVGTASAMQDAIARGEIVMMAADRVSAGTPERNVVVSLLDEKVRLPRGVFTFARLMECPVFFVACVKTGASTYTFFAERAPEENVPAAYAAFLERLILRFPLSFFHFCDYFRE